MSVDTSNIFSIKSGKKLNENDDNRPLGSYSFKKARERHMEVDMKKMTPAMLELRSICNRADFTPGEDLQFAADYLVSVVCSIYNCFGMDIENIRELMDGIKSKTLDDCLSSAKNKTVQGLSNAIKGSMNGMFREIQIDGDFDPEKVISMLEAEAGIELPDELKAKLRDIKIPNNHKK